MLDALGLIRGFGEEEPSELRESREQFEAEQGACDDDHATEDSGSGDAAG